MVKFLPHLCSGSVFIFSHLSFSVVEDGDTAEDQEARALLNKFLGASIIMKGVESTIPMNRETKLTTTTSTTGGKQPLKHEVCKYIA